MKKSNIKKICISAVMAAMYVGLDYFASAFSKVIGGNIKISLSGLPVIIIAVTMGPVWGMATGFIGAFLGQILTYGISMTTALWVLPAMVRGLSMGLLFIAFRRKANVVSLGIQTIISSVLVTGFNTLAMYIDSVVYHYYSYAYVFGGLLVRLLSGIATAVVFAIVLPPIIKVINKTINK